MNKQCVCSNEILSWPKQSTQLPSDNSKFPKAVRPLLGEYLRSWIEHLKALCSDFKTTCSGERQKKKNLMSFKGIYILNKKQVCSRVHMQKQTIVIV